MCLGREFPLCDFQRMVPSFFAGDMEHGITIPHHHCSVTTANCENFIIADANWAQWRLGLYPSFLESFQSLD